MYKIGNRVEVIEATGLDERAHRCVGKVGEIVHILKYCTYPYGVEFDTSMLYFREEELEVLLKMNDLVKVVNATPYAGLAGQIIDVDMEECYPYRVAFQNGMKQRFGKEELVLAPVCPTCGGLL